MDGALHTHGAQRRNFWPRKYHHRGARGSCSTKCTGRNGSAKSQMGRKHRPFTGREKTDESRKNPPSINQQVDEISLQLRSGRQFKIYSACSLGERKKQRGGRKQSSKAWRETNAKKTNLPTVASTRNAANDCKFRRLQENEIGMDPPRRTMDPSTGRRTRVSDTAPCSPSGVTWCRCGSKESSTTKLWVMLLSRETSWGMMTGMEMLGDEQEMGKNSAVAVQRKQAINRHT